MKKILFNLLILITSSLFYSCSIYNADNYLPQENVFIPSFNKNEAILRFEGREYYFNLESLFHKYIQNNESVKLSFPIVNKNLDSINVNNILLSDLKLWERKLKYFSNRYLKGESSIVFTVPGKIIVSLINKNTLKKINIKNEVMFSIENLDILPQYNYFKITTSEDYNDLRDKISEVDLANNEFYDVIIRDIIENRSQKCLVVRDFILLKNSSYALCIIYPIYGENIMYTATGTKINYPYGPKNANWDPIRKQILSYQKIKYECDPISLGVLNSNIKQK